MSVRFFNQVSARGRGQGGGENLVFLESEDESGFGDSYRLGFSGTYPCLKLLLKRARLKEQESEYRQSHEGILRRCHRKKNLEI